MSQEVKVSIVCMTYNHEKYIRQCLDGFIMQETTFLFEVLINDDASTDGTAAIIREYELRYPNTFRVVYQQENQYSKGVRVLSEILVPMARGKYIAFCEGDDWWCDPFKLQMQYEELEGHDDCCVAVHRVAFMNEDGTSRNDYRPSSDYATGVLGQSEFVRLTLCGRQPQLSSYFVRSNIEMMYAKEAPLFARSSGIGDLPRLLYYAANGMAFYSSEVRSCYRVASIGCWTGRIAAVGLDCRIRLNEGLVKMAEEYDAYTNGSYHDVIEPYVLGKLFNLHLVRSEYRDMMNPRFAKNRASLGKKDRVYIVIAAYLPKILDIYHKYFHRT